MKFIQLLQERLARPVSVSVPRPMRLSPPGSLRVIEGQGGAERKPSVRFSTRLRPRAR
jgi:hypothetical protein